jgi:hypothetical protein
MPAPRNYVRGYSFAGYQATNPNRPLPGPALDNELEEIEQSLTEAISGLNDIRRADGQLRNGIVGRDALSPDLSTGVRPATLWQAGIQYQAQDTVSYLTAFYRCTIGHLSTDFLADLTATRWELYAEIGTLATDVQIARNEAVAAAAAAVPAAATATAGSNNVTALYDLFDDRYLGEKTSLPTLDNDGNALVDGALVSLTGQTPTTLNGMYVRRSGVWQPAVAGFQGILLGYRYVATASQTVFSGADANGLSLAYTLGALIVTVNGVTLAPNTYTATTGTSITLGTPLSASDVVVIYSFGSFAVADTWTKAAADERYAKTYQATVNVRDFGAVGNGVANDTSAFQAALTHLNTVGGGELVISDGAYNLTGTILHTLTAPLRITFLVGSSINYGGTYTTNYLIHIFQAGFDCVIDGHGDNDINCNNNSPVAVYLRNENATKAVQIVRGLRVRNVRGSAGAGVYASGISIYGQSRLSMVENCLVQSVTRPAGIAGGACQAIVVSELSGSGHNPDVIVCRNNRVETVTSDDGANLGWDFDGIVLFQADVAGTVCISEGNSTRNCRGRSQKIFAPNPVVTAATIYRDIAGGLDQTTEIAIQSGAGSVRDVAVRYAGGSTHNSGSAVPGTTIVSFYTEAPRPARIGARIVDGVTIDDASTGGNTISAVVDFTIGNAIATANAYNLTGTVSNVQVRGKNIGVFVRLNNNGRSSPTVVTSRLKLENISGTLDTALGSSDSTLTNLFVTMSNVVNYGTDKAVISGVTYGATHGKWTGDSGCRGFFRNLGANANSSIGYCPPDAIFDATDATNWHGEAVAGSFTLAANATVDFFYGGPTTIDLTSDFGAWQASVTSGATVTKTVGGSTFLVGTLSEPGGAADLKLWSTSTEVMRLRNASASSATVTVQVRR